MPFRTSLALGLAFLLLALVAYWPAVSNGFIWDDDVMLTENEVMKAPDGLKRIWFSAELSDYFPLTSTSFWIEWRLWEMNAVGYNVTNILLHGLSGILLWRALLRLKVPCAWLAAVLFTLHPVCVASVDWIAERKNTLSMVFYLSALLAYFQFENGTRWRMYAAALGLFALALLSKTSVVILPLVLLLCAWWQRGRINRLDLFRTIPFFALSLVFGLITVWFQSHEVLFGEAHETDTFLTRVLGGSWALWVYLSKDLLPINLSMIYPQWDIDAGRVASYIPGLLWLAVLFAFWKKRQTWGRGWLFGFGYFTIALLPVLGFFDMDFLKFSQVADHLQYIAVPGIVALVVGAAASCFEKIGRKSSETWWWYSAGTVAVILLLSALTWKQAGVYVDEETLWRDTIRKNPNGWIGYHNLADRLAELRRFEEAAYYYQQSLRLEPDYAKGHNNAGNCLFFLGQLDDAIEHFLDAIQNKPEMAEAHNNLAVAYHHKGEFEKALNEYRTAIELKPDYAAAYFGAGNVELKLGNIDAALNDYFSAVKYNPDAADVHYNIGIILSVRGETNAAVRYFQHALRLQPRHDLAKQELKLLLTSTDEQ